MLLHHLINFCKKLRSVVDIVVAPEVISHCRSKLSLAVMDFHVKATSSRAGAALTIIQAGQCASCVLWIMIVLVAEACTHSQAI